MLPLLGVDLYKHPTEEALEAYVMRTLPETELGPLEMHVFFCMLCQHRLAETNDFVTAMRAAAAECLKLGEPTNTPAHRFTHDTDDGLIESEVTLIGSKKWLGHHWGPQLDGGMTWSTMGEAVTYLIESFQQMFPEHVCTTTCLKDDQRPTGSIVRTPPITRN